MALEFINKKAERRFIDMFDINKIRDTLDDENDSIKRKFSALKREEIWEESQAEMWEKRRK